MILITVGLDDEDDDKGKDKVEDSKRDVLVDACPHILDECCPCYQVKIEGEEVNDERECFEYGNEERTSFGVGFFEWEVNVSIEQAVHPQTDEDEKIHEIVILPVRINEVQVDVLLNREHKPGYVEDRSEIVVSDLAVIKDEHLYDSEKREVPNHEEQDSQDRALKTKESELAQQVK